MLLGTSGLGVDRVSAMWKGPKAVKMARVRVMMREDVLVR